MFYFTCDRSLSVANARSVGNDKVRDVEMLRLRMISDQCVGRLLLGVEPCLPAFLVDANVVRMNEFAVLLGPDGKLAVVFVNTQPADGFNPITQTAEVAAAGGRLVGQCCAVAAELERALRDLGTASDSRCRGCSSSCSRRRR